MVAWRLGKGGGGVATHAECRQPFKSGQPSLAAGHWFGRSGRVVWPAAILRAMSAPVSPSRPPPHATQAGRGGAGGALYLAHFGLQRAPFSIAPDPRALYMSERHREALAHLLYGVAGDGGFVLLTGEVGAGKTTVCRCFLEQVPADCHVAYIYNPKLTVTELLQTVCNEFHVPLAENVTVRATVKGYVDPLNAFLLGVHAAGQRCVLVIDEAQNLSASVLEQLRLLTNLETSERKLLQIILIGQPELRTLLARPELAQLAQRVVARFHLGPLDADDSAAYVRHRLAVAGLRGALPFDGATLRRIHALSGGVPRRINQLCDRALLGAYAQGRARVDRATLRRAAAEVYGTLPAPQRWRMLAVAAALLAAGAALGGWALWRGSVPAAPAALRPQPPTPAAAPAATAPAASAASAAATAAAPTPTPASAASAASPASAALATPPVASAPATTLALAAFEPDERHALAALLPLWQLPPASGDACRAAATQRVPCWRGSGLGLAELRLLDRPGLLPLRDDAGRTRFARLVGLDGQHLLLAHDAGRWRVPVADLAGRWRGEFITLWRTPTGWSGPPARGQRGAVVDELARALAQALRDRAPAPGQPFDAALARRLAGFQLAVGLAPDGLPGPTTLMRLSRERGLDEPRLSPDPGTPPTPSR